MIDQRAPHIRNDVALLSLSPLPPPARRPRSAQFEDVLDDAYLGTRRVESHEGGPVVHDETPPQHVRSAIDGPGHEGHLQQRRQLLDVLHGRAGMDHATVVAELAVTPHEGLAAHDLTEDLHPEDVAYYVLGLAIDVRMYERNVIIASDDVPERRQALLDPLHHDAVGEGIA